MKHLRLIAGIAVGALLLASLVLSFAQPAPLEVARAYCLGKGMRAEDLTLLGYEWSGGVAGNHETVEFQVGGSTPHKKVQIKLRQLLYFLRWQVVDFHGE